VINSLGVPPTGAYTGREGCGGVAPERFPEHPREQDQVARPRLDSLLHLRCRQIFPTSLLLRPRHSPPKCLFLGILPVTPNGSIFCREFPCKPLITKDHRGGGSGYKAVASCQLRDRWAAGTSLLTQPVPILLSVVEFCSRKPLRTKQLSINAWGSIVCRDKVLGPMILKIVGGGGQAAL